MMVLKGSALLHFGSRSLPSRPHTGRTFFQCIRRSDSISALVQMFHLFGDVDHSLIQPIAVRSRTFETLESEILRPVNGATCDLKHNLAVLKS